MVESQIRTHAADAGCEITAEVYRRLYPQLYAQIRRLGVPSEEVEDLIQETFLHAQQALDRGQFEGRSRLDTWIVSIAKKRVLKLRRRGGAAKRHGEMVPLDDSSEPEHGGTAVVSSSDPDPQTVASDRELLGRAMAAVRNLPESFRAPLVLKVDGHTYDEIATLLGIPISLVTSRIHQARDKLHKDLQGPAKSAPG